MNTFDGIDAVIDSAYLVVRSGGRWSDVFRLSPPNPVVIGRSSACEIVVRSDRASRKHAEISWKNDAWVIQDLSSRNGTSVGGASIRGAHRLVDGDRIEIAGFAITFASSVAAALGEGHAANENRRISADPSLGNGRETARRASDDQLTAPIDVAPIDRNAITERRDRSVYLHAGERLHAGGHSNLLPDGRVSDGHTRGDRDTPGPSGVLLKLAFAVARCKSVSQAVETTLETLERSVAFSAAGVYFNPTPSPPQGDASSDTEPPPAGVAEAVSIPTLVATRQSPGGRGYRQPPVSLVRSITETDGKAFLARNLCGDGTLATHNSRGELDIDSVIVAPIRDSADQMRGLIHLTKADAAAPPLSTEDLEFTVAAGEILGEAVANLATTATLSRELKQSRREIHALRERLGDRVELIGQSEAMNRVGEQISLAAPTQATVLVRGESGVGKELVAAAIHHASDRSGGPLVCLNCAALSPSLLESELFGHEKGAFTGATARSSGKFEAADGGTIMMDEIGEMPLDIQAKFLRVLEGHPFERVGGNRAIQTDVRVVAATNRDLQAMVRRGEFREDLFYRLDVVEIFVPPLRERADDVIGLADFFLKRFNREMGRRIEGFTDPARADLIAYRWPGNVRELKNVIERAVVFNRNTVVTPDDLVFATAHPRNPSTPNAPPNAGVDLAGPNEAKPASSSTTMKKPLEAAEQEISLDELQRRHILRTLDHTGGNKSRAASILGIERSTLDRRLKRYQSAARDGR